MAIGQQLQVLDTHNPKEIIMKGLELKVAEQGDLRVAFDITTDYPSRETFEHDREEHRFFRRRIVVKKLNNVIHRIGIGKDIGDGGEDFETGVVTEGRGWIDQYLMEISVWSIDSADRDNIVELVKLWMLELEQEIQAGYFQLPFLFSNRVFSSRFIRAYEDVSYELIQNNPMYIGSLVYEVYIPFYHEHHDELQKYKAHLIGNVVDCIQKETSGGNK